MKRNDRRTAAVLGGGLTGLTAAYYLLREASRQGVPLDVTLVEASGRLGGLINTLRRDGFHIERGPDSFLARKTPMIRLAEELGIADELTGTNPAARKTYIVRDGVLHLMPAGLYLGVPTSEEAFMETGLLSEEGKRRALEEKHFRPSDAGAGDESAGEFLERHFGPEMVDRIFEPLLAGIYAGDLYRLSLEATFPQFREIERRHGSLMAGIREARLAEPAQMQSGGEERSIGSVFLNFRRGLSTVTETLEARLKESGCVIRLGEKALSLSAGADEGRPVYRIRLENGEELAADAVAVALPAAEIARLLAPLADVSAMRNIPYLSVANVVFGYDAEGFDHPLDGTGFLVPRSEGRLITASTWTSSKWPHTAPPDKRLIRCYVGRAGEEENVELSDEEMIAGVYKDLKELMGLAAKPKFVEITRLRRSMIQYPVGHRRAMDAFLAELKRRLPGVVPAGQPFGGVGLPDCVAEGKRAAEEIVRWLAE